MFETISTIDWANISHSHDTAEDVPVQLAALAGTDKKAQDAALSYFWEYMLHQGSRYEASPNVVPFLFEVLESTTCSIQRELIDLLRALGVGYGGTFLPFGYDLKEEERRFQEQDNCNKLYDYEDARSAYFAVHNKATVFARFLGPSHDPDVRLSAAFAVAHFAQPLSATHRDVARYIQGETDEAQLHSLLLCYGMLGRFAGGQAELRFVLPYLEDHVATLLRVSAAIAIVTVLGPEAPESARQTLLRALGQAWTIACPREDWEWWNEGDLLGYAALALRLVAPQHRDEIVRALCEALTKTDACTFAIPNTLLDLLFPEPKPVQGWDVSDFDDAQRTSLKILLATEHWKDFMINFRFLPSGLTGNAYQSALAKFLFDVTGEHDRKDSISGRGGNVSSWNYEKHWPH